MKTYFALFCLVVAIGAANAAVNTTKCNACLMDEFGDCGMGDTVNCSSPETQSCYSAAGRYKYNNGSIVVHTGVARGCISCHNATVGCKNFKMDFDNMQDRNWTLLACDIKCCKGDQCNNQTVAFPELPTVPGTGSTAQTGGKTDTEPPSHATRHFPAAVMLAIAAIVGTFFFH
ncbi:putative skeletal organic matrix protein 2 [Oculina patagonica]